MIGVRQCVLALLTLTAGIVATPASAAAPGPVAVATSSQSEIALPTADAGLSVTLFDLVDDLERAQRMRREIEATLRVASDRLALAANLDESALDPELERVVSAADPRTRARYLELRAMDVQIRERLLEVDEANAVLGKQTRKLVADYERLDREAALWPQRAKLAREREAPAMLLNSIDAAGPGLVALRERLRASRDPFLIAYEHGVRRKGQLEAIRADVADRRERLDAELNAAGRKPIWQPGAAVFPLEELRASSGVAQFLLAGYLRRNGEWVGALFVLLTTLLYLILRRPASAARPAATAIRIPAVTALCGALIIALPCVGLTAPAAPIIVYRFVFLFFPLCAGVIAVGSFARDIPATAWALMLALFLNALLALARTSPVFEWLLLVVQTIPFVIALARDWRRGSLARFLPNWRPMLLGRLVRSTIAIIVIGLVAGLVGHASVATGLVALVVIAPAYVLAFSALAWALDRTFAGLLATPVAQCLRSAKEQGDRILGVLHRVSLVITWSLGGFLFVLPYASIDDMLRIGAFVASASLTVGEVTIALNAILLALVVIVATWLVTKLVRFVLDYEVLPRLDLRTGVPIAVSTIVGYVLVVTGFVLAMAALGIDLTKVTLLAGAVGVGVGLGLQNVVNNFASGLILMIERPINVGDQIDVGGVVGEVRRIGVRSSTIRTAQGAEIIVPNADLAGKQVTNWTLSDRARRYEIDVGVAYGSDPARILQLLESAAAQVPEVQKVPLPRALFVGFGDSSLDFRLFAWVESVDVGMEAQNGLRTSILRILGEAGIEIPFPQRDVHIRIAPESAVVRVEPLRTSDPGV